MTDEIPKLTAFKTACPNCGGPFENAAQLVPGELEGKLAVCTWCDAALKITGGQLRAVSMAILSDKNRRQVIAARQFLARELGPPPRIWRVRPKKRVDLRVVYADMDRAIAAGLGTTRVSCRRRCDTCCHERALATVAEARLIVEVVRARGGEEAVAELRQAARAASELRGPLPAWGPDGPVLGTVAEINALPRPPCPLLKDHECSVYAVRPGLCRAYYVQNDPANCGTPLPIDIVDFPQVGRIFAAGVQATTETGSIRQEMKDLNALLADPEATP